MSMGGIAHEGSVRMGDVVQGYCVWWVIRKGGRCTWGDNVHRGMMRSGEWRIGGILLPQRKYVFASFI